MWAWGSGRDRKISSWIYLENKGILKLLLYPIKDDSWVSCLPKKKKNTGRERYGGTQQRWHVSFQLLKINPCNASWERYDCLILLLGRNLCNAYLQNHGSALYPYLSSQHVKQRGGIYDVINLYLNFNINETIILGYVDIYREKIILCQIYIYWSTAEEMNICIHDFCFCIH